MEAISFVDLVQPAVGGSPQGAKGGRVRQPVACLRNFPIPPPIFISSAAQGAHKGGVSMKCFNKESKLLLLARTTGWPATNNLPEEKSIRFGTGHAASQKFSFFRVVPSR